LKGAGPVTNLSRSEVAWNKLEKETVWVVGEWGLILAKKKQLRGKGKEKEKEKKKTTNGRPLPGLDTGFMRAKRAQSGDRGPIKKLAKGPD